MSIHIMASAALGVGLIVGLFFLYWKFWFLRDPERVIPSGDVIVSPADGTVLQIIPFDVENDGERAEWKKGGLGHIQTSLSEICTEGYIVSIFMSPFAVHFNRAPIAGTVIRQQHMPGKFLPAYQYPLSLIENEKNEITLRGDALTVKVIQVAGFLVRQIQSFVHVNDRLEKGQRLGLINFGSQCSLILPKKNITLTVKKGDTVYGGSSILATCLP